jgi:hypothetical protein
MNLSSLRLLGIESSDAWSRPQVGMKARAVVRARCCRAGDNGEILAKDVSVDNANGTTVC